MAKKIRSAQAKPAGIKGGKPQAMASASYDAASTSSQEMASYRPPLTSADAAYNTSRDTIVSRTRHLLQNSGWASSALTRHLDNVIGVGFRPALKPDYVALGWTRQQSRDFASEVQAKWRLFANDPDCYIDVQRRKNFTGLMRTAFREWIATGEALAIALWIDNKPNNRCGTTIQLVDSDLLSNPNNIMDSDLIRAGVELDEYGAAVAYHFRQAHPSDLFTTQKSPYVWERVARTTEWGRRQVIHSYEELRPNQTRGISRFTPILERFVMLDKYDRTELQAAMLNAVLAAYVKSPMDHDLLMDSIEDGKLSDFQDMRGEYSKKNRVQLNGATIPMLFPGEEIGIVDPKRATSSFADFERTFLRSIAAALGLTYEQVSQDWSQVNYSSARAALMEIWKTLNADRTLFADQFATPIFALWFEEMFYSGGFKTLPEGSPDYLDMPAAYLSLKWIGMGRGYVDPEKEANAALIRMQAGISTLEDECAEQGKDWEEVLEQQAAEMEFRRDLGLPDPEWAVPTPVVISGNNQEVDSK